MRLRKALNNNVALVLDSNGEEAVVMGRGVAFRACLKNKYCTNRW